MRPNVYGMACEGRIYNPKGEKQTECMIWPFWNKLVLIALICGSGKIQIEFNINVTVTL